MNDSTSTSPPIAKMEDEPAVKMMQHEDHAVNATPTAEDNAADAIAAEPTESTEKKPAAPSGKKERKSDSGGLSTIRRFSTLLRGGKKDDGHAKESAVPETPPVKEEPAVAEAPMVDAPTEAEALTAETPAPAAPTPDVPTPTPAPPTTPSKAKKDKKAVAKPTEQEKTAQRRSSFFLNLSQRNKKTKEAPKEVKEKTKEKVVVKKGAAKGSKIVLVTGANEGVGLELVRQFAAEPNTFVIALAKTADKVPGLKSLVTASAKSGHNVRTVRLDVTSSRSIASAIKEITELTDGRVDLLVNAATTTTAPTIKVWELKGTELQDELQSNLIGPIAFTNALLPFLKAEPEVKKAEEPSPAVAEAAPKSSTEKMEEAKVEVAEHMKSESMAMKMEETATATPTTNIDSVSPAADTAPAITADTPAATTEEPTPSFPSTPFVLFLTPSEPIANVGGQVYSAVPAPQTLFSISRAAVQVAVAKYAVGLAGRGVGVVGLEDAVGPYGDDVSGAAKSILKVLPRLTTRDNGKLVKAAAV
ncbi:hypothetical protein M422DRAFT_33187 [Sphaerobolus stellatus SS14]|uniref:Uncharacterized protein n=1 Tax=Sphaerobolus stellatus (strain SS14) TaxID=990650 RepID=A0A0C9VLS8_SPHS4|nr:hypothetical protein M422DRAFT_33187 [Sphaerobolus stellatus SS14]